MVNQKTPNVNPLALSYSSEEPQTPSITVLASTPGHTPGTAAVCSVRIGDVTIHGVTVRAHSFYGTYVNLPSRKMDGQWTPLVEVTPALQRSIADAVLAAVRGGK